MANIKSQKKRNRTNEKAHARNKACKSELKTALRRVREAVAEGNHELAQARANYACKLLDKANGKGIIPKNQAANKKSGIQKLVNTLGEPLKGAFDRFGAKSRAKSSHNAGDESGEHAEDTAKTQEAPQDSAEGDAAKAKSRSQAQTGTQKTTKTSKSQKSSAASQKTTRTSRSKASQAEK